MESGYYKDLGVDVGVLLKRIFKKTMGSGMDWIYLPQDRTSGGLL